MGYRKPDEVVAPKSRWELKKVICNTGQGGWAAAEGIWDDEPALGIRWNGDDDSGAHGSPQSHGNPTWFIVPPELVETVRDLAHKLDDAMSFVECSIDVPEDFAYGVFKVTINVHGKLREAIAEREVAFDMPLLAKRFFRPDTGFWTPPVSGEGRPRGLLKSGVWKSIVQTNGIAEDDNPTKMDVVKDALIASVLQALKPFLQQQFYGSSRREVI
jgi:hypothetical protein